MGSRLVAIAIVCLAAWGAWVYAAVRVEEAGRPGEPAEAGGGESETPRGGARRGKITGDPAGGLAPRVRIAALGWSSVGAPVEVLWEQIEHVRANATISYAVDTALRPIPPAPYSGRFELGFRLPGHLAEPPPARASERPAHHGAEIRLRLEYRAGSWGLVWDGPRGHGVVSPGGLAVPALSLGARNVLLVVRLEEVMYTRTRWQIAEWRQAVVKDLERVANGLEAGADRERALAGLRDGGLVIPAWMPLPEAIPALRRVADASIGVPVPYLARARVLARDLVPLLDEGAWLELGALPAATDEQEPVGHWLARLALTTNHPRVRDQALEALAGDLERLDPDLLAQVREGLVAADVAFPDGLPEREAPDGRLPPVVVILLAAALVALGGLLAFGRGFDSLVPAAAWMVVVGVALSSLRLTAFGTDLGLESVGWLWAACGALCLAGVARALPAWLSGTAFLLAAGLTLAGRLTGWAFAPQGAALLASVGVAALPLLALRFLRRGSGGVPLTPLVTLLGLAYAVHVGEETAGAWTRELAAFVVLSLALLVTVAHAHGRHPRGAWVRARVVPATAVLVVVAIGASLWATRVPLPVDVSLAGASWHASRASVDQAAGRPEEAAAGYHEALASLDWWRRQRGVADLPPRYPKGEARQALIGLIRARSAIAKRRVAGWALPAAEAAALDGLLEFPSGPWATALFGRAEPTELARERRELLRVVALGESRRRSATGVLAALRAVGEPSLVDPAALDRLATLLVASSPALRLDGIFVLRVLVNDAGLTTPEARALWTYLGRDPARLASLVLDQVNALADPDASPATRTTAWTFLTRFVHETAPFTGADLAESLARRAGSPSPLRPLLVELVCRVGDLPITLVDDPDDADPPAANAPREEAALALWREVRAMRKRPALGRRIAYAIAALSETGEHTTPWLRRHTARPAMSRAAWEQWFSVASLVAPEVRLAHAVGWEGDLSELSEDELLELVYPREGRASAAAGGTPPSSDDVARQTSVLALCVDDDVRAPVWCAPASRLAPWAQEPLAICAAWQHALSPLLGEQRFRIRVARFAAEGDVVRALWDDVLDAGLEGRASVYQLLRTPPVPESVTPDRVTRTFPGEGASDARPLEAVALTTVPPVFHRSFQVTWDPAIGYRLSPPSQGGRAVGPREIATYALPPFAGASPALATFEDARVAGSTWAVDPEPYVGAAPLEAAAAQDSPAAAPPSPMPAVAWGVSVLLLLLRLAFSGKAPRRGRVAAALLVLAGLGLSSYAIVKDGVGWPTLPVGLACATLGAFVLARCVRRASAWVTPLTWLVATVLAAAFARGWGSAVLSDVVAAWARAGILAIPLLAGALVPTSGRREWLLAYALLGVALSVVRPFGEGASPWLSLWLVLALLLLVASAGSPRVPVRVDTPRLRARGRRRRR